MEQLKPFTHTARSLPFCLVPYPPPTWPQMWRVLLCGVQIAEAFHRDGTSVVSAFSPDDTGLPSISDVVVPGPDADQRMREALDRFAFAFLIAAHAEQAKIEGAPHE
jgi:hypothetical protein